MGDRGQAGSGSPRAAPSRTSIGIGCGLLAALIWGGFPVVTRLGVTQAGLDTYDVTFIRFLVSGLLLLPVLVRRGLRGLGAGPIALMAVGVGAPYILVVSAALGRAPVAFFALTPGSMIVFTALLSGLVTRSRLTATQIGGIVTVVAGLALATAGSSLAGGASVVAPVALFLAGGLLWAVYNVTTKACSVDGLSATAIVSVASALIYGPAYLATRGLAILDAPAGVLATQALYQGVLVSILGLVLFTNAVGILGAAVGATFAALVPLLATLEAELLLGEHPRAPTIAGILIVTVGMAASLYRPRAERSATSPGVADEVP